MGYFSRKNHFPVEGRTVLITGASQGMGKAVARKLAEKGANVLIVARTESKLRDAVKHIAEGAKSPSQRFDHISADLTTASECSRIINEATVWNNGSPPDIVWCCAGAAHPTLFIESPIETIESQMTLNYFSAAYVAHTILKAWLGKGSGTQGESRSPARHLIFTASVVAFVPIAGYSFYSPPKCALRGLSDALSQELNLYNATTMASSPIQVHTIFPGTIFSEGLELENQIKPGITKKLEEDDGGQSSEDVAKASIAGLEKGQELIVTNLLGRAMIAPIWGASKRSGWAILDTLLGLVMSVVMIFVRSDLDGKVQKWAKEKGVSGSAK